MAETDLVKLYSQRILALASDVPHAERLAAPDASVQKRSPLCGSTVVVDVVVADGALSDLGMDVKACALGQASAAILGGLGIGRSRADLAALRDGLRAMLKREGPTPPEFEVLTPAVDYRNRHASILLAWDAVVEAMAEAEAASSGDDAARAP